MTPLIMIHQSQVNNFNMPLSATHNSILAILETTRPHRIDIEIPVHMFMPWIPPKRNVRVEMARAFNRLKAGDGTRTHDILLGKQAFYH